MSNQDTGFANVDNNNAVDAAAVLTGLANNLVKVMHGTADGLHPLAGHTVAAVRSTFSAVYNIPNDAGAFIGGRGVAEDYVLRANETLEFVKEAGEKG